MAAINESAEANEHIFFPSPLGKEWNGTLLQDLHERKALLKIPEEERATIRTKKSWPARGSGAAPVTKADRKMYSGGVSAGRGWAMRIELVGLDDPRSIHSYSGKPYCMAQALVRKRRIVFYLHLTRQNASLFDLKARLTRCLTGRHIIPEPDSLIARHYPEQISRATRPAAVCWTSHDRGRAELKRNVPVARLKGKFSAGVAARWKAP